MKKWKALDIVQLIISLVVVSMSLVNLLTSPTHDYFQGFVIQFFVGLMFGVMALNHFIQKQKKFAIFLSFVMLFSFYASFYIFNVR
ncbi:hypothetical protein [Aneurinibacillus aneurinilyticus]|jgi:uncharacterized protein YacL|uniref:DUF3953 domain-containing protein n=2 Tax=Aneurinibacillus aneurinilyticus TaxID=1391 RepID=A0A848CWL6_ANEAE|nr:hypothetical protein [Aneurinibacillus aneurinilyticus]ERI06976.1 hypothetical protein HMPREF0083_04952 [Aneurinibacillus aneurinilyticus ATCC 12856]MCI1694002.1 hypothetical protein [Aneurinibacillus aneurinilyticus]MED0668934.1 hypothetical protein [Aneurinibacillus aneurinilyticus]MED0709562.1 hypothetical protein [Aneurinibacillus aneurinilyticus]MED0723161.1 hypothetical protein [Aneurinibacillus aneurinilyticus]